MFVFALQPSPLRPASSSGVAFVDRRGDDGGAAVHDLVEVDGAVTDGPGRCRVGFQRAASERDDVSLFTSADIVD